MILTVASYKGGVAKTTTAVHLACFFHLADLKKPVLLVDGDPNRSATGWAKRGKLPFRVVDERQATRYAKEAEHIVIDTQARPSEQDLEALVDGCDLLILPTTPDALALDATLATVESLKKLNVPSHRFRVLLTIVPPKPSRDGAEARMLLASAGLSLFAGEVSRLSAFTKSALAGVPVYALDGDPRSQRAWQEYNAIGAEIISIKETD